MRDKFVEIDRSVAPNRLVFSPRFNAAVPFIDRHLDEGRGDKPAIRTTDEDWTYSELACHVSKAGTLLRAMGLAPGDRVLMVVRDCPQFIALFFGAIKAGDVPPKRESGFHSALFWKAGFAKAVAEPTEFELAHLPPKMGNP